jgi:hypothetical protein
MGVVCWVGHRRPACNKDLYFYQKLDITILYRFSQIEHFLFKDVGSVWPARLVIQAGIQDLSCMIY